jgi:hypothetical protein
VWPARKRAQRILCRARGREPRVFVVAATVANRARAPRQDAKARCRRRSFAAPEVGAPGPARKRHTRKADCAAADERGGGRREERRRASRSLLEGLNKRESCARDTVACARELEGFAVRVCASGGRGEKPDHNRAHSKAEGEK